MTIERKLTKTTAAGASEAVYVEDVFSTWLYTGNGSSQTITNGIDLATKGGMVWLKDIGSAVPICVFDTVRTSPYCIFTNSTEQSSQYTNEFGTFLSTGFTVPANNTYGYTNYLSGTKYVSFTFRKQAKFFDCIEYTGTGSARTISHALGSTPGMIIVKRTDTSGNWQVYHRSLTSAANSIQLNLTNAQASATTVWNSTAPNSSVFSVGTDATVNASGGTYVAYLFAHDAGGFGAAGTDSVVSCGSYTGNGSASGPSVSLGWEPQFVLVKNSGAAGDWSIFDNMRGISTGSADPYLFANTSGAEATTNGDLIDLTPTGFTIKSTNAQVNTSSGTYIYLAIRRGPMKTPTDATKVFAPVTYTGNGTSISLTTSTNPDAVLFKARAVAEPQYLATRLAGYSRQLPPASASAELQFTGVSIMSNNGFTFGSGDGNTNTRAYVALSFTRAPGFFDVVCYTGTGANRTVSHNLGVAPELMIVKSRSNVTSWTVYSKSLGAGPAVLLNFSDEPFAYPSMFNSTEPTSTVFSLGVAANGNASGYTYVAYLFASCPGVSKVGSYTGNGSSQTINCGFTNGARFVLIKRTDSTGDWYVWDTARGIVSGNDPRLSLNTTAAEVTTDDTIDPASSGFIVNQVAATNVNVSSGSYIYLAIA